MMYLKGAFSAMSLMVMAVVVIAGCSTPRGLQHKATRPVAQVEKINQSEKVMLFAKNVSLMAAGSSDVFEFSPEGEAVTVKAGNFYTSALNQKCRKASFEHAASSQEFAVCSDNGAVWYYMPSLNKAVSR